MIWIVGFIVLNIAIELILRDVRQKLEQSKKRDMERMKA